jgi:hypothetical protein
MEKDSIGTWSNLNSFYVRLPSKNTDNPERMDGNPHEHRGQQTHEQ